MRRFILKTIAVAGTGLLVACGAVLGVDDFTVKPGDDGVDANMADSSGGVDVNQPPVDSGGIDANNLVDANKPDTSVADSGSDADADAGKECTLNKDCEAKGENFICRKADSKCVSLLSSDCTHILGDYKDDNAILIGSVLPTAGADETSGKPEQNAIDLAINEFLSVTSLPPTPGSTARRPLVLIGCNDNSDGVVAVKAAKHLVNDVKVSAIIGAAFSGITLKVANEVTIPSGTFLISPSATSVQLTDLQDNGLVWRTIASDNIQGDGHAAFYPLVEAKIKGADASRKVKVAIAHKGDAYGSGLADALSSKLVVNGKGFLATENKDNTLVSNYGDPDATPGLDYSGPVTAVVGFRPDVVYLMGTTEVVTKMMIGIETDWDKSNPTAAPRPLYLLADGGLVGELPAHIQDLAATSQASADDLRRRVLGTVPGTVSDVFTKFRSRYDAVFPDKLSSTSGVSNAYDALYNLAYAFVALGPKPITGVNIRDAFGSLVSGTAIETGTGKINAAFTALQAGNKINYDGASGPLDYDLATGEAPANIQIWCMSVNGSNVAQSGAGTSVLYDAATKTLKGTYATLTTECKF